MQNTYDVIIIGSGIVGVSTAWHLRGIDFAGSIAIVERDPSFSHSSTAHAVGGIWQQFSLKENIQMSLYGAKFLKEFAKEQNVDLDFQEHGYLFLAEEEGLDALHANVERQRRHKADIAPLTPSLLQQHFPWLNTDGLAGGALGLSNEGWFDSHRLHSAMRSAVRDWDVTFIKGSVTEIDHADTEIRSIMLDNGRRLKCGHLVNATGPNAGNLTRMARIRLPIEPRKRSIFVVHGK
ncbi:MAG: FAD-dependent oxidoreductase, partial [Hyphomicrobiales bacterium]